jgi:hypothetical protein
VIPFALQSDIIGACQFLFAAMTLPTILSRKAAVPRLTSGVTAAGLWLIAAAFFTMGPLWVSFAGSMACAAAWTVIFWVRPTRGA